MRNLILIPTEKELTLFVRKCSEIGMDRKKLQLGEHGVSEFSAIEIVAAQGGLGKAQFGVQTQYFIDRLDGLGAVFCVGASGGLEKTFGSGDIVVATETIEHDMRKHSRPLMPRFQSDMAILEQFRALSKRERAFSIHFGPVASGDEDIMTDVRKCELRDQTGAVAVAWEGAGGARACRFSNLPFIEVRGITDLANHKAQEDFFENLELVMSNLAELMIDWAMNRRNG